MARFFLAIIVCLGETMINVAFFDTKPYDIPEFERNAKENGINIKFFDTKLNLDTVSLAKGFDCVCVFVNDNCDKSVIESLYSFGINVIAFRCAGFNNVDLKAASNKIHLLRVPAYSPYAVAEHACAMLLTSIRRTHKAYIRTKDHNFSLNGLTGFDLHGKTVGIIGTGKIGRVFADICKGFGMNVICYDINKSEGLKYYPLETVFKESDIISLHCPLNRETYHLINSESLALMKRNVVIINTSRGALIDADALLNAIKERQIGAACLDVYEEESNLFFEDFSNHIINDDCLTRLISMPNVLVTSHQAFLTEEALENIAEVTVKNIVDFFKNGKCENEIKN